MPEKTQECPLCGNTESHSHSDEPYNPKMTETKQAHTPGPWVMAGSRSTGRGTEFVVTTPRRGKRGFRQIAVTEKRADANLIAASPKLLEALEHLLAYFEEGCYQDRDGERLADHAETDVEFARAAIAQAMGES